jgi:hypothetical protein
MPGSHGIADGHPVSPPEEKERTAADVGAEA